MEKKNGYELNDASFAEIPEFVYESLARSLLPIIQKYYESDEGKKAFAEWKDKKSVKKALHKAKLEDCHARQSS